MLKRYPLESKHKKTLPPIPSKRYFAIGEASKLCDLKPHVLRYWEQEFSQLTPVTRRGNRRYYQQEELLLIRKIRQLLYFEGFTIQGAKSKLSDRQFVKDTTSQIEIDKAQAELPLYADQQVNNNSENLDNLKIQLNEILKTLK